MRTRRDSRCALKRSSRFLGVPTISAAAARAPGRSAFRSLDTPWARGAGCVVGRSQSTIGRGRLPQSVQTERRGSGRDATHRLREDRGSTPDLQLRSRISGSKRLLVSDGGRKLRVSCLLGGQWSDRRMLDAPAAASRRKDLLTDNRRPHSRATRAPHSRR